MIPRKGFAGTSGAALLLLGALPLAVWPGVDRPFSTPKLWLLSAGSMTLLALTSVNGSIGRALAATPSAVRWTVFAWTASFAWSGMLAPHVQREALMLGLAGPAWWLVLVTSGVTAGQVLAAQAIAAAAVAGITLAQWFNHDPFVAAGWTPAIAGGSARLRMYGTLGNPNFVAAWLAIAVPGVLALAVQLSASRRRVLAGATWASLALALAAIGVTGSRGGALGLATGVASLAVLARLRARGLLIAAALAVLLALAWMSTARPIGETLAGRMYIWAATVPHALERPLAGWGPGAFELVYNEWQGTTHRTEEAGTGDRFAGPQQQAHNDYLEALVERGVPGFAVVCFVFGSVVAVTRRDSRRAGWNAADAGAASSVAAAAAVAMVDFPLARPAEVVLLWSAVAVLSAGRDRAPAATRPKPVAQTRTQTQ